MKKAGKAMASARKGGESRPRSEGAVGEPEPRRYEFRTVADFIALPYDKLDACLTDFRAWCLLITGFRDDVRLGGTLSIKNGDVFTWIDDGKHEIALNIKYGDGSETRLTHTGPLRAAPAEHADTPDAEQPRTAETPQ